jgi:hypothetical protein
MTMKGRMLVWVVLLVFALGLAVVPASAHEGREVDGYELHFGWRSEPAYAGLLNGPEVFISVHEAHEETGEANHEDEEEEEAAPFPEDIPVSLQVEVTLGGESLTLPLEPAWQETGHYVADLIPTRPGDYTFRVFGTIGDTAVDETFSSIDGQFSAVEPASDIMFPQPSEDVAALLARIEALEARVAALEGS